MSTTHNALNENGNHQGEFTQGVGGWAEYAVWMTPSDDKVRHDVTTPPGKVIPVIFLPGVMGSNLRMSKKRKEELQRPDNRAWQPDDLMSKLGQGAVVSGEGYGGWLKNASPKQRQLNFDPNETEVEYYHYTEDDSRFDPEGKETQESDARHQNVPDSLNAIPPLLTNGVKPPSAADFFTTQRKVESAAQKARWRGWSEVLFDGAYGNMLQVTERYLNNIAKNGNISPLWQLRSIHADGKPMLTTAQPLTRLVLQHPSTFGSISGEAITDADLEKIAPCWYPVHAMGYNWIKSNAESAKVIAERIRGLVKGYKERGFKCDEVIIITHSMGGLLARALIHPDHGNLQNDADVKILGIYHNVMPTLGAASAYKRMRFGFQDKPGFNEAKLGQKIDGLMGEYFAKVIGIDGQHATAILANAPAPLEMLPGQAYGPHWLKVIDGQGKTLASWPNGESSALDSIYLQPEKAWWRLVNPLWVNPGDLRTGTLDKVNMRLRSATDFLQSIAKTFHSNTYASFCASLQRKSYGEVVFQVVAGAGGGIDDEGGLTSLPPPESWILLTDDAKNTLTVQAGQRILTLKLQPASAAGDETVPSDRSAEHIVGKRFIHGRAGMGYEHQKSYADPQVQASLLYSIVQIAMTAKWEKS